MSKVQSGIKNLKLEINSVHFIGICGIGMSGLAQAFAWLGYNVSGSDRAIDKPENKEIINKLSRNGIHIFHQDGSFIYTYTPDILIFSTAIEDDNPDLTAGKNIIKWHRAEALAFTQEELKNKTTIAITGSCGKTTVTAWAAETLFNLGLDPIVLNGGMINSFTSENLIGNFKPGNGNLFVYEADESDKSLLSFDPDYSVILNIGTDHYSKEELVKVFGKFLRKTKKGAVLEESILQLLKYDSYSHLDIKIISTDIRHNENPQKNQWYLTDYRTDNNSHVAICRCSDCELEIELPLPGKHNAENALAIVALLDLLNINSSASDKANAVSKFGGTHRRFEFKGKTSNGSLVIDDYAHNVEKIISCIKTTQTICCGNVYAVFQPHGFAPFNFMKDLLFIELERSLRKNDRFILLPVYYAGGTSSFTPKSSDVNKEYKLKAEMKEKYLYFDTREQTEKYLLKNTSGEDIILIMGARDGSLALWSNALVLNQKYTQGY